jgi:hypothetical protein
LNFPALLRFSPSTRRSDEEVVADSTRIFRFQYAFTSVSALNPRLSINKIFEAPHLFLLHFRSPLSLRVDADEKFCKNSGGIFYSSASTLEQHHERGAASCVSMVNAELISHHKSNKLLMTLFEHPKLCDIQSQQREM